MVDTLGVPCKGKSPLIYLSDAPMCQMNYGEALEKDGTFGEVARNAWRTAGRDWHDFGNRELLSTLDGRPYHLNDREMHKEAVKKLLAQLDALQPGLRAKMLEEKRAKLTPEQVKALATPIGKRTTKQHQLVGQAEDKLKVTHKEVAMRMEGPKHTKALKLANEIEEHEGWENYTGRERDIVNFDFWRLRAEVEQQEPMRDARKLIYKGDQALAKADIVLALKYYNDGLAAWRKILDQYPQLKEDTSRTTIDDLRDVIKRYRQILKLNDKPFPKDFILQDIDNSKQ